MLRYKIAMRGKVPVCLEVDPKHAQNVWKEYRMQKISRSTTIEVYHTCQRDLNFWRKHCLELPAYQGDEQGKCEKLCHNHSVSSITYFFTKRKYF
mmetsp:Transcript_29709/g.44060  ORF Transcript_29709/g.44060 Transcript_29709/m.44060 type:complete len:95 (-) Transcript_29709:567-851(-)